MHFILFFFLLSFESALAEDHKIFIPTDLAAASKLIESGVKPIFVDSNVALDCGSIPYTYKIDIKFDDKGEVAPEFRNKIRFDWKGFRNQPLIVYGLNAQSKAPRKFLNYLHSIGHENLYFYEPGLDGAKEEFKRDLGLRTWFNNNSLCQL
ncbi:MAG: hypothetical protein AB7O96_08390 [Pseudobdellovibrionaceae bacterium]